MQKGNIQSPGWFYFFRHEAQQLNHHGADVSAFELGGDQTHGLIAHRSHGHQQGHLDAFLLEDVGRLADMITDHPTRSGNGAHERQVAVGQ